MCADAVAPFPAALAQAFDAMHEAALLVDPQGRVMTMNAAARRLLGRPGPQERGQLAGEALAASQDLLAALRQQPMGPAEITLGAGDTTARYELMLTPLFDASEVLLGQLVTLRSVTNPPPPATGSEAPDIWNLSAPTRESGSETFAALRESEARSRALVNALPDTILRLGPDGQILDFQSRDAFGLALAPQTAVGQPLEKCLPPQALPLFHKALAQAAGSRQPQAFEYAVNAAGQPEQTYEARLVMSGPDEVVLIIRDVSERARLEQMKSDFIHRAAHDLRTPLTTASLAASIIQEGGTPEELEQYWRILRNELGRQRDLIEELLTLGRLESGTFQLTSAALEVGPVLLEALDRVRPLAEKRRVQLAYTIAPDLPRVVGDRNGLAQVFINLLDNAIKFSPPETTVDLEAAPCADGISIRVRDRGMGIPQGDLPHLFTRFFRADNAIRNEIQGTGVGLFITKAIVDQLNGRISIESQLDSGTTFEVWLPRQTEGA